MTYDQSRHAGALVARSGAIAALCSIFLLSILLPLPTSHAQTGDFSLRTTFRGESLPQGSTDNYNEVNVTSLNGFSGSVSLTVAVSPIVSNGPNVSLYTSKINVTPGTSNYTIITVVTVHTTPVGNYTVTITGMNNTLSHTTSFPLYVTVPYQPPDFSITSNPSMETSSLTPHSIQSMRSNLTLTSINGFSGTISLSFRSDPGPSVVVTPSSVILAAGKTANATLTIQTFLAGNYTVTVTGTISGYPSHSATVTFEVLPPASDIAILAYRLSYNARPAQGETLLLTSDFTNQGAALITVTGLTFNLGFASSTPSGLPMNLTSGQSRTISATIQIPSSAQLGNQSLVATLEWMYYAPGQGLWLQGQTKYISASFSVSQSPFSGPAGQIVQLIGKASGLEPWLIIAWAAVGTSASVIVILRDRKRRASRYPVQHS